MKSVHFEKRWRWPTSETSYEEYAAGSTPTISDGRAAAAEKAGVLKSAPVDAPADDNTTAKV